jgi:hypothetical protein
MISVTYRRTESRNLIAELADGVSPAQLVAGLKDGALTRGNGGNIVDAAGKTVAWVHDDMPDAGPVEETGWDAWPTPVRPTGLKEGA